MENKLCEAHDCSNVIRGRRSSSAYCTDACRQRQKRFRKENGITGSSVSVGRSSVVSSGNLINDVSQSASLALLRGSGDPVTNMMNGAVSTCVPYAIAAIRKYPILSLALAWAGYKGASSLFSSCTDTTTVKDGKTEVSKTCKKANVVQKTGGAAVAVIGGGYLLDTILDYFGDEFALMTLDRSGVKPRINPVKSAKNVSFSTN